MTRLQERSLQINQSVKVQPRKKPLVINCRISRGKLITQLDDGREVGISVSLLTKWSVIGENVKPEQLRRNEIKGGGNLIYFPDIDEALPTWKIIEGLFTCN